jgi:hypothetical protein
LVLPLGRLGQGQIQQGFEATLMQTFYDLDAIYSLA